LVPLLRAGIEHSPGLTALRAALAAAYAQAGQLDLAAAEFRPLAADRFGQLRRDLAWTPTLCLLAVVCEALGDSDSAEPLYALLRPHSGHLALDGLVATCFGSVDVHLGKLAEIVGNLDVADAHYRAALELEARIDAPAYLAVTRASYARMLACRNLPGDAAHARELARAALATAEELGLATVAADARSIAS
jgi:tetratricopeptide (TPR) repeat protein